MAIDVFYIESGWVGYHPVSNMARLAAELFETELVVLHRRPSSPLEKASILLPRGKRGLVGLLICPWPADLASVLTVTDWRKKYERLVVWVFDSFWPNAIPRFLRWRRIFDHVFVTEQEELAAWRSMLQVPVDWLPWGSDVLRLGSDNADRRHDLLRLGRQPPSWEDDTATALLCESMHLQFRGRPPYVDDPTEGQRALMNTMAQTKFTLSFSNLVNRAPQTHPHHAYITGRWTDALSAGAIVAGIPPCSDSVRALLWEDAMLDLGSVDRRRGLDVLVSAVRDWTPQRAKQNHLQSLQVLDWRWRFENIANVMGVRPHKLDTELSLLRQTINDCRSKLGA